jgi:outer membrane protein OmpU
MNNFKKVGISALAGSLAMVSANAVEYTMSGGMQAVFSAQSGGALATEGKGLGAATDLGFNASGELENGYTVGYFMSLDTDNAVTNTSAQMTIGMGSLGTLQYNVEAGSKANGIDDITPNAYNETWDGLTTGAGTTVANTNNPSFFGSATASGSIDYRIPAQEIMGTTVNASVTYDPNAGTGSATKGGAAAGVTNTGSGTAYTLQLAHESGVEFGGGLERVKDDIGLTTAHGTENTTLYVKYAIEGLSAAYQVAYSDQAHGTSTVNVIGADKEAKFYSAAYTMGDLTVSYGESELKTKANSDTVARPTIDLSSLQAAYTMGAMTISAAMSETDNHGGVAAQNYDENTISVSFAF